MDVGNGFFTVHFEFIFIINGVVILISRKFRQLDLVCLEFLEKSLLDVLMESKHDYIFLPQEVVI